LSFILFNRVITVYGVELRKVRVIWLSRKRRWVCFGSGAKETWEGVLD